MATAYLTVVPVAGDAVVDVEARGGTRRERGSLIAAYVRKHPELKRVSIRYSETYGFQTATYARYAKQ